ncbi:hypothetical protein AB0P15_02300 [Streptomyces sp. NPDC087917]|uniref:hypothetical protein n=1 Tax=Streptomyces sp. NPDC087917 TaxID=3155060 RepID=UPI00343FD394
MEPNRRPPRPLLPLTAVAVALLLAACGTKTAPSSAEPSGGADRPALEERARAAQVAVENVYVTEVPGYEVAPQSVGVLGADGFSAVYVRQSTGSQIRLGVEQGSMDASSCPKSPIGGGGSGAAVVCVKDGERWYRTDGAQHEYVTEVDGRLVTLGADTGPVDRATLRAAARAAHRATDAEMDAVLPPARPGTDAPVERGDLPPVGDGAPNNDVGASG